jgi:tetratricopeptide (TPR) repeat protein
VDLSAATVRRFDRDPVRLLPLEQRLLRHLSERPGATTSRQELLTEVWQVSPTSRTRTVDMTVRRLRQKIERDPSRPDHLITVAGQGYRLVLGPRGDTLTVGRDALVGELLARWSEGPSCLVGPPGAGKTHVALEVARRCPLAGGAWAIDADGAMDVGDLVLRVAMILRAHLEEADPEAHLMRILEARGPLLLILDGCETAPAVAEAVRRWRVPGLALLLTSRVAIAGATSISVPPLDPDAAIALFAAHAARVRDRFRIDADNQEEVRALVAALDHLPLAIVLAAGRAGAMSPAAMRRRLTDRLRLLDGGAPPGTDPRHRSLAEALEGSWEALDGPVRRTLAAAAVFRGGCGEAAQQQVLTHPERIDELWRRSLVQRDGGRVSVLDSVRDYVAAQPEGRAERERAERAHAAWCVALPAEWDWAEHSNLDVALERALGWGDGPLAGALALLLVRHHRHRGSWRAGVGRLERVLALDGLEEGTELRLRAARLDLQALGGGEDLVSDEVDALVLRAEAHGDPDAAAAGLVAAARALRRLERRDEAERAARCAAARAVSPDLRWRAAACVGGCMAVAGRPTEAMTWMLRAEALAIEAGSAEGRRGTAVNVGQVARLLDQSDLARERLLGVLPWLEGWGADRVLVNVHEELALIALDADRLDEALDHAEQAHTLCRAAGFPRRALSIEVTLALIDHLDGRQDAVRERLRDLVPTLEAHGDGQLSYALLLWARANAWAGDVEAAATLLDRAEAAAVDAEPMVGFQITHEQLCLALRREDLGATRLFLARCEAQLAEVESPAERAAFHATRGLALLGLGGDARAALAEAEREASRFRPGRRLTEEITALREALRRPSDRPGR